MATFTPVVQLAKWARARSHELSVWCMPCACFTVWDLPVALNAQHCATQLSRIVTCDYSTLLGFPTVPAHCKTRRLPMLPYVN